MIKVKYLKTLFIIVGIVVLVSSVIMLKKDVNVVIYENYVAKHNDKNVVYTYEDEIIELSLRWINEEITKGPYSLFLAVNVKDERIDNIYLKNLKIRSSNEIDHQFRSIMSEPLVIYNADKKDSHLKYDKTNNKVRYYQFDDTFNFDFEGNEKFILMFSVEYEGVKNNEEKDIEVKYEPHIEKINAPVK